MLVFESTDLAVRSCVRVSDIAHTEANSHFLCEFLSCTGLRFTFENADHFNASVAQLAAWERRSELLYFRLCRFVPTHVVRLPVLRSTLLPIYSSAIVPFLSSLQVYCTWPLGQARLGCWIGKARCLHPGPVLAS